MEKILTPYSSVPFSPPDGLARGASSNHNGAWGTRHRRPGVSLSPSLPLPREVRGASLSLWHSPPPPPSGLFLKIPIPAERRMPNAGRSATSGRVLHHARLSVRTTEDARAGANQIVYKLHDEDSFFVLHRQCCDKCRGSEPSRGTTCTALSLCGLQSLEFWHSHQMLQQLLSRPVQTAREGPEAWVGEVPHQMETLRVMEW